MFLPKYVKTIFWAEIFLETELAFENSKIPFYSSQLFQDKNKYVRFYYL